jgi:hypothetical protein
MKVSTIYGGCSVLPGGGGPATDALFLSWLEPFVAEGNARILDRYPPGSLPNADPLPIWRLVNHLLKTFHRGPIDWKHFNHRHRIRALAVLYADRPGPIEAEAANYVNQLMAEIADR